MTQTNFDPDLVKNLEKTCIELKICIQNAIKSFYKKTPKNINNLEVWKSPSPWEKKVLPNLELNHNELLIAIKRFSHGDIKSLNSYHKSNSQLNLKVVIIDL